MKYLLKLMFIPGILIFFNTAIMATPLGDLAKSMKPGTWAVLSTIGFDNGDFLRTTQDYPENISYRGRIIDYVESAVWDPNTRQFLFMSAPHNGGWKFAMYSDDTNSWQPGILPFDCMQYGINADVEACGGHAFDLLAIDASRGEMLWRYSNFGPAVFKYNTTKKTWGQLPAVPDNLLSSWTVTRNKYGSLEYFPDRDGLLSVTSGLIFFYDAGKQEWSKLPDQVMGRYENVAEYNPVHKVIIFGGGNTDGTLHQELYKMDATGKITRQKNAPIGYKVNGSVTASVATLLTVDPVSGKYLLLNHDKSFYEYDVVTDTWKVLASAPITAHAVAAPVNTYGVVMFVSATDVYLYKHGECANCPAPKLPDAPAGLKLNR